MTQINSIQNFIADLDMVLPWLLPVLETIDRTVPPPARLLICIPLLVWFAVLRHRHARDRAAGSAIVRP